MITPKVSVVMSVYNGEKYLREAIDSILEQAFRDLEFVIVDDGSTDSTWAILASYNDPRIVLLRNEENIGLTRSLNKGLAVARGEYIARMDADDTSLPERLEKQVAYLDAHPGVGLIGTWVEIIGERGERLSVLRRPVAPLFVKWSLLFDNCLIHSTVMYRRALVEKLGGYDLLSFYAQDYELWSLMSFETQIAVLPEILVRWRSHSAGISAQKLTRQKAFASEISARTIRRLLKNDDIDAETIENMRALWSKRYKPIHRQSLEQVKIGIEQLLSIFCEQHLSSTVMSDVNRDSIGRELDRLKRYALSQIYFHTAIRYYRSGDMVAARHYLLQAFVRRPASVTAAAASRIVLWTLVGERVFGLLKRTRRALLGENRSA